MKKNINITAVSYFSGSKLCSDRSVFRSKGTSLGTGFIALECWGVFESCVVECLRVVLWVVGC